MSYFFYDGETSIRLAEPSDLAMCVSLERLDEFGRTTELDAPIIEACIRVGGILLAEQRGRIVGYASLNFLYASRMPLLSWWYVAPEHRGRGLGSLLLCAVEQHLMKQGFERFFISACREIEINRHRKHNLREIGCLDLGDNEKEVFFEKKLN
ncbi:GNAT family N-acetyltransferase [Burkholderia cenocepacia]|uniref:GNAT family N-acetyltransferase n=1 Tax=Burkholderia cenocepacia TaxID=95486 RepID=UPI0019057EF5|nr:GNAT family N-acetyltransferase [Burkholderia cenocepacia]MBJ9698588.1 GNAT family N-acetyltransferase [Burkholderia cenocepacia]